MKIFLDYSYWKITSSTIYDLKSVDLLGLLSPSL